MAYNLENYQTELQQQSVLQTAKSISANGGITIPTGQTLAVTDTAGITVNSVKLPAYEIVTDSQSINTSWAGSHRLFVNDSVSGTYKVAGASVCWGTQSTSGSLQIEVTASGVAIGSGTNQLTGALSLNIGTNAVQNGTVIASPTTVAAGSSINAIFTGTTTGLGGATINVVLQRLS